MDFSGQNSHVVFTLLQSVLNVRRSGVGEESAQDRVKGVVNLATPLARSLVRSLPAEFFFLAGIFRCCPMELTTTDESMDLLGQSSVHRLWTYFRLEESVSAQFGQ